MQPRRFMRAGAPRAIQRPTHARQRGKEAPIARPPILAVQSRIATALAGQFSRQIPENILQPLRLNQMLNLRKTPQADLATANLPSHSLQLAGLAERAHATNHRIEQPKEKKTQVIGSPQLPSRIFKARSQPKVLLRLGQALPKIAQQFPVAQLRLRYGTAYFFVLRFRHLASDP